MKIEATLNEGTQYQRVVAVTDNGETASDFIDVMASVGIALGYHPDSLLEAIEAYLFSQGRINPCGDE